MDIIQPFMSVEGLLGLASLALLEIVLGIDNIVFIAILTARLPREQQPLARRLGLGFAVVTRLLLLFALSWIMTLERPLFSVAGVDMTGRGLILLAGGLFLIAKAAQEIYIKTEGIEAHGALSTASSRAMFGAIVLQIGIMDIIFSLDSIITAVGMVNDIPIMVAAILIAIAVMIAFADPISEFVNRHPSIKLLALAFLLLIGVLLVAEGTGRHVEKGYIYFSMGFALFVEILNMRYRRTHPERHTGTLRLSGNK